MKRIICLIMMAAMLLCVGFGTKSNAAAEPGQEPDFELQPRSSRCLRSGLYQGSNVCS